MTRLLTLLFVLAVSPVPGWAQSCPVAGDRGAELDDIYARLAAAPDEVTAQALSGALWRIWLDAPDPRSQALLDEGMARREAFDFLGARDVFDRLVEYCPDYAEGYNQRAFASFLRRDFEAALGDLDRTLAIRPRHLGALTGKAMTLIELGRDDEAQTILRGALKLNPWLWERALLTEPEGQDI